MDVKALRAHVASGKPLAEFGGGGAVPKDELLQIKCDVLVPAAVGGVITEDNAASLQCRFLVEAANGPTTPGVRRAAAVAASFGSATAPATCK